MFDIFKKSKKGEVGLKCPRCGIIMKKFNKADVVIDICQRCRGMWLDDDEINKLVKLSEGKKNVKKVK